MKASTLAGIGITTVGTSSFVLPAKQLDGQNKTIGIIGMDTSHSPTLVKLFNNADNGYQVTTAYTTVSRDIPTSLDRVDRFTKEIQQMGVEIVPTIEILLAQVDYILLCTVDGRLHLEQVEKVFKAGKKVFIDKPLAASLPDVIDIFNLSRKYKVPFFSSSPLRFMDQPQKIRNGSIGEVQGVDVFTPIIYEATHPEFYWYGIHGIELMFTVMKSGCIRVKRQITEKYDLATVDWGDGKVGTYRGLKNQMQDYGGHAFGDKTTEDLGKFVNMEMTYEAILHYFNTGEVPVSERETIEIFTVMDALQVSGKTGKWVYIKDILQKHQYTPQ